MTARYYYGDEDDSDALERRETRAYYGAHNDDGAGPSVSDLAAASFNRRDGGWPVWALTSAELAADWPEGIADDRVPEDYRAAEGHYGEDD